jgi:protein disulfide-isomerase A1
MISIPKILLICAVVLLASAYTEENNVLILTGEDFPGIIKEFPLILIEFYAPWCGHCKRLAPIYDEVATELKNAGSTVRLAKVDCDAHPTVKGSYSVQGFPTLLFFNNGVEVKYNGQRSKEFMVNWLSKKTRDPVVAIAADQLAALATDGKVNIVFHGDITSSQGSSISAIAVADDYNSTFSATQLTTPLPLASSPRELCRSSDLSANPPPPWLTRTSRAG